jgi:hypothetical protein
MLVAAAMSAAGCGGSRKPKFDAGYFDYDGAVDDDAGVAGRSGGRRDGGVSNGGSGPGSGGSGPRGGNNGSSGINGGVAGIGAGGVSGVAGATSAGGPAPGAIFCDENGNCLYPSGLLCFTNGQCCYPANARDRMCCVGGVCQEVPPWVMIPEPPPDPQFDPWVPPIDKKLVGATGWRDSADPLCFGDENQVYTQSLWSDSRGVWAVSVMQEVFDPNKPDSCAGCFKERLHFNDGTGWKEMPGVSAEMGNPFGGGGQLMVTGFNSGPIVLYGYSFTDMGQPCGLSFYDDEERSCQSVDGVTDVAVVNDHLAYAVLQGDLIRYDGERWGPLPIQTPAQHAMQFLWADDTVAVATGMSPGSLYMLKDGAFRVEDTRTLELFSAVFGFGPNDIWAGTYQGGLYHYDGTAWSRVEWEKPDCGQSMFAGEQSMIFGMWGANGVLYFNTINAVVRVTGTTAEILTALDCNLAQSGSVGFTSIWGNSENEVFIGMIDQRQRYRDCGPTFLLYYDGSKFHQM